MGIGKLELIDLDQDAVGYRRFVSCWLWRGRDLTFIVDPGPKSTIFKLIETLCRLGVRNLDYVLLTHIHLDHGGGAFEVLRQFPSAKLFCHGSGVRHILEPAKLWQGSKKVLKEVADMYGEPEPIDEKFVASDSELESTGIRVIETPGHAVHHVSFFNEGILFVGEALGTYQKLSSGGLYLRPATPPRFFLEQALGSIAALASLKNEPEITAFAHYGSAPGAFSYVAAAKEQLLSWVALVRELKEETNDLERLEEILFQRLMKVDPYYGCGHFDELDEDLRVRERYFLRNTLEGILGYLDSE